MKTILLIDDEINLLNAYFLMLEKKGFRVLKAINGNEGLKIMLSEDIDLVVSDIYMPQKNGLVVIKQIRRILKYRNIPIIILSAGGTKKNVYTSIGLGINAFLIKPCSMEKLYQTVEEVLSSRNNFKNVLDISKIDNDIDYSNISIMFVYNNANVTDNVYEFLTEHFNTVCIEENVERYEENLKKKNIDLLIVEISSPYDRNFKFLLNIYNVNKYLEIPIIVISETKNDLKALFDCLDFHIDKIIMKPFEYGNLLKTILQVTNMQYLNGKLTLLINKIKKELMENREKELNIINFLRNKIYRLRSENLKLQNNIYKSREERFMMFSENNRKISMITKKISKVKKIFLNKRQNLLRMENIIETKLKFINKKRISLETY